MHLSICRTCAIKLGKLEEFNDSMSGNWEGPCQTCGEAVGTMDVDVGHRRTVKKYYYWICSACAKKLKKEINYFFEQRYGSCKICGDMDSLRHIYVKPKEISDTFPRKRKVFS